MRWRAVVPGILALGILAAGPWLLAQVDDAPTGRPLDGEPNLPGCDTVEATGAWQPTLIGADRTVTAGYLCHGVPFRLTIGQYLTPVQGEEAASDLNVLTPDAIRYARSEVELGEDLLVNEHQRPSVSNLMVWTWYGVGTHTFANPLTVKAVQMVDAIRLTRQGATVAVLSAPVSDPEAARAVARRIAPEIRSWMLGPATR